MRARFFLFAIVASAAGACSGGSGAKPPGADGATADLAVVPETRAETSDPADVPAAPPDAAPEAPTPEVPVAPPEAPDGGASGTPDAPARPDAADAASAQTLATLYCPPGVTPGSNPLPADRTPKLVPIAPPGGIMFLEGPVWLADRGVLLVSEWNGGHRILQVTPPQAVEVFLPATGSNGLAVTPDGKGLLVISETAGKALTQITLANKNAQTLVQDFDGQAFVQPNDLAVRADGTIFFTDYQAGRLYRRATDGKVTMVAAATHANGVSLSPDEKTLYLASDARVLKYPLGADGALGAASDLTTGLGGADGMAVDCAGNVFIAQNAGGAVVVVSAAGAPLGELTGLPRSVTNAAFGGPARRTLYITTSSALYALDLQVAGLPY